jgi:hypothetical protein
MRKKKDARTKGNNFECDNDRQHFDVAANVSSKLDQGVDRRNRSPFWGRATVFTIGSQE